MRVGAGLTAYGYVYPGEGPVALYAWWAAGRRVRIGACQWAGMRYAADIGMKRGDCAATYAEIVINACTCARTQGQWYFVLGVISV